ncbi:hypothetical protein H9L39_10757 [Fusarium oxysporum f. sp. albedinis]|nr:hypothetical protein H9L39_10757 [Fusarium oxysporum f. sp. albedinis]
MTPPLFPATRLTPTKQIFGHFPMRLAFFLITRNTAITVVSWPVEGCSKRASIQLKNQKGISARGDFVPWLCALCHS